MNFDCIIVGGGPGGYVAAIRAAQFGLKTAVVEKAKMGGQCLNWGCIPSKALMESAKLLDRMRQAGSFGIVGFDPKALTLDWGKAISRKDKIVVKLVRGVEFLMKKNGVEVIEGEATILGPTRVAVGEREFAAKAVLVATGAVPDETPVKGLPAGVALSVPEFFSLQELPERILVFGSGGPACEMALMLALAGVPVELAAPGERLLPFLDEDLGEFLARRLKKLKVPVHFGVETLSGEAGAIRAGEATVAAAIVVNCGERRPVLPRFLGPKPAQDARGFLKADADGRTSLPGLYAAGDVTGLLWAQAASAQGAAAVAHIAGKPAPYRLDRVPINLYLDPEIASVGLSESELKASGRPYRKGEFSLSVNGKALAEGQNEGFVKVLADERFGEVLGVHVVAANATDLIAEAVAHLQLESTLEDIAQVIHAHPTLSEAFWEASFDAAGAPLHK